MSRWTSLSCTTSPYKGSRDFRQTKRRIPRPLGDGATPLQFCGGSNGNFPPSLGLDTGFGGQVAGLPGEALAKPGGGILTKSQNNLKPFSLVYQTVSGIIAGVRVCDPRLRGRPPGIRHAAAAPARPWVRPGGQRPPSRRIPAARPAWSPASPSRRGCGRRIAPSRRAGSP